MGTMDCCMDDRAQHFYYGNRVMPILFIYPAYFTVALIFAIGAVVVMILWKKVE